MSALDKFIHGRRDRAGTRYYEQGGYIYVIECDRTRVISFDEYIDKFSTFFRLVTRKKICAGVLTEPLPQPIAEEISEYMI